MTETVDLLAGLHTGAWLDVQEFPPLSFAVPGIIPEGFTLLVGPPKVGKSWLALSIALAVASGGYALGRIAVGFARPVLVLALEDGDRRLQERCRALLQGRNIPGHLHYLTRLSVPGTVLATVEAWLDKNGSAEPLVVVDTLGKCLPPALAGESAYGRDYRIGGALKRVVDAHPGASLVALHHDRKAASDDFVDAVSGTHGLAGAADTIVLLSRPRQSEDGVLHVTGRDVPEGEYAVTSRGGVWSLLGSTLSAAAAQVATIKAAALGDRSVDLLRFISDHPDGVRRNDVAQALGIQPNEAGVYLGRLLAAGRVRRASRGLYTPVISVVSVISDEDDDPQGPLDVTQTTEITLPLGGRCTVCSFPLASGPAEAGETTHPTCQPGGAA